MELQAPPGVSGFDLALAVVKVLERDHGGIVTDVDMGVEGLQFRMRMDRPEPMWRRNGRVRADAIREIWAYTQSVRNQCQAIRKTISDQRAEILRRREWLQSVSVQ
jgi:hypothetical protein